jgi:serine/threonine protein phosphatase PrpC
MAKESAPNAIADELVALANHKGGPDNISALIIDCRGGYQSALPADSVPPPPGEVHETALEPDTDPELLILGIVDVDGTGAATASDDLLKAIEDLVGQR